MPLPSTVVNNLNSEDWVLILEGPIVEAYLTGTSDFYYLWAENQPVSEGVWGHFVAARANEPVICPDGLSLWGRAHSAPCNLTVTVEPEA